MRADCQTARHYQDIDVLFRKIEKQLYKHILPFGNYPSKAISLRICQLIAMHSTDPLLRWSIKSPGNSGNINIAEVINAEGIFFYPQRGATLPSVKIFCREYCKFIGLWLFLLIVLARSLVFGRRKGINKATLLHGVPEADLHADGSADRFENFCYLGQLKILRSASKVFVQSTREVKSNSPHHFHYVRTPLLHLFILNRPSLIEAVCFLKDHFLALFQYLQLLIRAPITCLLWKDIAMHAMAQSLNRRNLIENYLFTNTNWLQQFLWMTDLPARNFRTEMIMYSLNSSGLVFRGDPVYANHPSIRHLKADRIYIWNESYRDVLKNEGIECETEVVHPILFYLPTDPPQKKHDFALKLCIFDVSPSSKQALKNRGLLGHYYCAQNMRLFLDDLLIASREVGLTLGRPTEMVLKHKRIPTPVHDVTYFEFVSDLLEKNNNLKLAPEDANLFDLIIRADVVIVIPFSSPAYIAQYLNVPTFFYDPTGELLMSTASDGIPLCSGREQLNNMLQKCLKVAYLG